MFMENEDIPFRYRSLGKSELALLYIPDILPASAMREFNEWINAFTRLAERLCATGLAPNRTLYAGTGKADSRGAGQSLRIAEISAIISEA